MFRRSIRIGVAIALSVTLITGLGITAIAPTAHQVDTPERIELTDPGEVESWLDETMAAQLERYHTPGAAVVLVRDGEVFLAKGYGYADLESETPVVANETVFNIGSTGKLVTWTAVMQGIEDGRLELDRDVNDYLTDSPVTVPDTYSDPITLEHLGTHSAGYEDSFDGMLVDDPAEIRPLGELLAEHQPARVRPPGEFVAYSNYGTALAGHVVAEQYDTTFTEYAEERIFTPLAMDDTTYAQPLPDHLQSRRAIGYTYQNGQYQPQSQQIWTMAPEGGSLSTTGADMGRFMLAHLNEGVYGSERILKSESVREMHQRHFTKVPRVPELNGMAYGFIEMDRNDERIVGHWGDTAHFKSLLTLFPERDTGLFVVYNSAGGDQARFELLDAFVDRYYPRSDTPVVNPSAGAAARAAQLTGDYRSLTISETSWHRVLGVYQRTVTVSVTDDGYLRTLRSTGEGRSWVELRPGVYEALGGDEKLVFRFDDKGRATHLFFGAFGPATYERLPWYESRTVTGGILVGGVLAFVSTLVLWVGIPLWRRVRSYPAPSKRERGARTLLGIVSVLWLSVVVVFGLAMINFNAEVASPSLALQIGQILPYLGFLGTIGAAIVTALVWRDGYWNFPIRLHYTLVTAIALLVTWQLYYLRIFAL